MSTPSLPSPLHTTRIFRVGRVHHFPWLRTESTWAAARLYPDGIWRCLGTALHDPAELDAIVLRCVPWNTELRLTLSEMAADLWQFTVVDDHGFEEPR